PYRYSFPSLFFFFQAEDGIRAATVTGVQTCALPIFAGVNPQDFAVLLDRSSHGLALARRPAQVAKRADVDVRQQAPRRQIVGIEIGRASCRERVKGSEAAGE